jgi:hypothetical protein
MVFSFVGIVGTLYWLAHGSYLLYDDQENRWRGSRALLHALAWLYTVIRPVACPTVTPPFDNMVIYLLLLAAGVLELGGYLYDNGVYGAPLPSRYILAAIITNLVGATGLLAVVAGMPLAIPSERVEKEDIVSSTL